MLSKKRLNLNNQKNPRNVVSPDLFFLVYFRQVFRILRNAGCVGRSPPLFYYGKLPSHSFSNSLPHNAYGKAIENSLALLSLIVFMCQHPLRSLRFLGVYNSFTTGNRDPIENSCGKLEFTTAKNSPPQPQAQFFYFFIENTENSFPRNPLNETIRRWRTLRSHTAGTFLLNFDIISQPFFHKYITQPTLRATPLTKSD